MLWHSIVLIIAWRFTTKLQTVHYWSDRFQVFIPLPNRAQEVLGIIMALFSILSPLNVQLLAIILTLAVLPLLRWLQRACLRMNSQEPPLAMPGIPFVGHLIGILRYQTKYFPMLRLVAS